MRRPLLLAAALAVAAAGAATAGLAARAGSSTVRIPVSEREFRITMPHSVPTGRVTFVVHDSGRYPHALEVAGPGLKASRTPLIHPGKTATLTVTLRAGTYRIWCPVPGHAQQGMEGTFVAKSGAPAMPAPTTDTTPTTTSSGGGGGYGYG